MNKVLIISYYFPPVGGGGVTRTLKYVKYLCEFNWEPFVLTASGNPCGYGTYDPALLEQIPKGIKIATAKSYDPISIFQSIHKNISLDADGNSHGEGLHGIEQSIIKTLFKPLYSFIDQLLFIPDSRILWLPTSVLKSRALIRANDVDLIYTTGPPHATHLIGLLLKKITKKPLVIDFRDGWTSNPLFEPSNKFRASIENWMEKIVLNAADMVISTTSPISDELLEAHPEMNPTKFIVITNGYDSADYIDMESKKQKLFTITHTGVLRDKKTPDYFIKALHDLLIEHPDIRDNIRVNFVGNFPLSGEELVDSLSLRDVIKIRGYVSHQKSIEYQINSDVLLLLLFEEEGGKSVYPGKLFEYIAAKKPILAAAPDGITADLIKNDNLGIVIPPKDIQLIKDSIYAMYLKHNNNNSDEDTFDSYNRFDRKELTRQLANTFNKVVKND